MSQSTAKPHHLESEDGRKALLEGENGKQGLVTKDPQLQLLQSIDDSLKKILFILEANT